MLNKKIKALTKLKAEDPIFWGEILLEKPKYIPQLKYPLPFRKVEVSDVYL